MGNDRHVLCLFYFIEVSADATAVLVRVQRFRSLLMANSGLLHQASREGDLAMIGKLLSSGTDVNAKDKHKRTPLHIAAWAGQTVRCYKCSDRRMMLDHANSRQTSDEVRYKI